MPAFKKLFVGCLILIANGIICALVSEAAVRNFVPLNWRIPRLYRVPHPELGWVLKANTTYTNRNMGKSFPVSYNSNGWRDVEHDVDKKHGVFRILVLGDSFMEGYSVPLEASFPRVLERQLNADGIAAEVFNLGVGGYGSIQL